MDYERLLAEIDDHIQKAVTNSTYTMSPPTRSIYAPENLDPKIKVVVPVSSPVRALLPRVEGFGQVATWRKLTSGLSPNLNAVGPTGTGVTMGFADAGQPNQTTQTYTLATASYKNLGRDVEIGRQALASNRGGNLEDMRQDQEMVKTIEVLQGEDNMLMNGSASVNALEFDGFQALFLTNSGGLASLGYETPSGIATYARTVYNQGAENPQVFIANPRQGQALVDALQGTGSIQRIVVDQQGAATGGAALDKIVNPVTGGLIKFQPSRYSQNWGYLLTINDVSGQNWLEVEDLDPLSVYDVPTANHSLISRVYETTVLKVIAESFQMKIGNYSTT